MLNKNAKKVLKCIIKSLTEILTNLSTFHTMISKVKSFQTV